MFEINALNYASESFIILNLNFNQNELSHIEIQLELFYVYE